MVKQLIRNWHDWRYVASVAAVCGVISLMALTFASFGQGDEVQNVATDVDALSDIATSNRKTLTAIETILAQLTEQADDLAVIRGLTDDILAEREAQGDGGSEIVSYLVDTIVICADPARQAECAEREGGP